MDVALEELDKAVKLDASNPKTYNIYGLVYGMLGENEKAAIVNPKYRVAFTFRASRVMLDGAEEVRKQKTNGKEKANAA